MTYTDTPAELAAYRDHATGEADDLSPYPDWALNLARRGIRIASKRPDLTRYGFRCEPTEPEDFCVPCVATSVLYILAGPVRQLRTVHRYSATSYGWKHRAERWGRALGFAPYVMNGDFIAACLALDLKVTQANRGPNAWCALRLLHDHDQDAALRNRSGAI